MFDKTIKLVNFAPLLEVTQKILVFFDGPIAQLVRAPDS